MQLGIVNGKSGVFIFNLKQITKYSERRDRMIPFPLPKVEKCEIDRD